MIKYDELCKRFCELESRYQLFELDCNGITYWKYARYYLYRVLLNKLYGIQTPWLYHENMYKIPKYSYPFQRFTDWIFHNVNIGCKKDILLFTFNRRVKKGRKYISPVTDEITLHMEQSCCVVESPIHGGYYRPTPIPRIKYFDVWNDVGKAEEYKPISRGELRRQLLTVFEKEFDIVFTNEEKKILLKNVNYFIMYRRELMANYKKLIKKICPKLVFLTQSYIGEWVVLTETLQEMGIPSVEILHGYVDDNYVPYNYAIPGLHNALPDYILAYSQIQKDTVNWGIPKENILVVGYPEGEKRARELIPTRKKKGAKKRITFISSMMNIMGEYVKEIAANVDLEEYEILFKLHPNEYQNWEENYPKIPESVKIIDNNDKDIHYFIAISDAVIGINSTALFEAAFYPTEIFILEEDSYENMGILLNSGKAKLIHGMKELIDRITRLEDKTVCDFDYNAVYSKNSIQNIQKEVQRILNEMKPI